MLSVCVSFFTYMILQMNYVQQKKWRRTILGTAGWRGRHLCADPALGFVDSAALRNVQCWRGLEEKGGVPARRGRVNSVASWELAPACIQLRSSAVACLWTLHL
jgi:hypothetical protein